MSKIDILIPCAGNGDYVEATIGSVLRQDYADFRLWLIDNASSHLKYKNAADGIADERIRYLRYEKRLPMTENWNRCLESVDSDFFCFIHDDDIWAPNFLTSSMRMFQEDEALSVVLSSHTKFSSNECSSHVIARGEVRQWTLLSHLVRADLLFAIAVQPLAHMSALLIRGPVMAFDASLTWVADQAYLLAQARRGVLGINGATTVAIRMHTQSGTASFSRAWASYETMGNCRRALTSLLKSKLLNSELPSSYLDECSPGMLFRLTQICFSWPLIPELVAMGNLILCKPNLRRKLSGYSTGAWLLSYLPSCFWMVASFVMDLLYYRKLKREYAAL